MLSGKPPPVMWQSALMPSPAFQRREQGLHIDPGRLEQGLGQGSCSARRGRAHPRRGPTCSTIRRTREKPLEWTPEEGRPISTSPAVTSLRQQRAALGRAHGETGEVVIAPGIKARHFRRLAADQRAARLAAALGDALDDGDADLGRELSGGEVVEEEQGLRALDDDVVDAHGHEIDADRVVDARVDGDLHLGADAVIGGHQDRVLEARGLEVEQAAEPADLRIGARAGAWRAPRA